MEKGVGEGGRMVGATGVQKKSFTQPHIQFASKVGS